ncbi:MAG: tetratricopeptide repeat protein [Rhodothermales bacterium]
MLALHMPAGAQPAAVQPSAEPPHRLLGDAALQLFSATSRTVVGRGETFALEVEAYASPPTLEAARRVTAAFQAARLGDLPPGATLLRREDVRHRLEHLAGGGPILVLTRRYLLRSLAEGPFDVPPLRVRLEGRTYATAPHRVEVYRAERGFFDARRAVVPIVAERVTRRPGRYYARTGTAFLIAPDALVTSLHVVLDAPQVHVTLPSGRRVRTRRAWAIDPARDVAVLYIDPKWTAKEGMAPLQMASVFDVIDPEWNARWDDPGERVAFTSGWPGGVQRSTVGVRYEGATLDPREAFWVTSNAVRPGDSGGPLLDAGGRVLGVVTSGAILRRRRDVLREEVCIATDPRPALGRRLLAARPRRLKTLARDLERSAQPHMQALRLTLQAELGPRPFWTSGADLDDALARLDAAVEETPADAGLLFTRGAIRQRLGTQAAAVQDYRSVLAMWEGHFPAAYLLAVHHLRSHAYAEAESLFQHTRRYPPYAGLATYGLAQIEMRRLRYREAAAHLQAVLHRRPNFAPALYNLARCYFALGDTTRVRQLLVKLRATSPVWSAKLRRMMRYPVLQPVVLLPLPRADISENTPK